MKPPTRPLTVQRSLSDNPARQEGQAPNTAVDLQALAREVVRLLKEELRLENERLGRRPG